MRAISQLSWVVIPALALGLVSCRKAPQVDATQPLQQSFQTAEPQVQQAIAQVSAQLKAGQYAEATRTLAPVVSGRPLSDSQRQAVGVALQQINRAVAANPKLDTKEMYELRARMFQAAHGAQRF
jgi:Flp pilus assembly protein TadD